MLVQLASFSSRENWHPSVDVTLCAVGGAVEGGGGSALQ